MTQASFSENVYGLIIGISNYKDPAITKLDYTVQMPRESLKF